MNVASRPGWRFSKGAVLRARQAEISISAFFSTSPPARGWKGLTDDVGRGPGGDQQAGFVFQRHLRGSDPPAESGQLAGGCEARADTLVQVVGAQVDGADPAKALHN